MKSVALICLISLITTTVLAKTPELSVSTLSGATLTVAFDRTVKLNEKNKFRFPVTIDSYNRCYISSATPHLKNSLVIPKGSQWQSGPSYDWTDWDSKKFSFKITNRNNSVMLACELNLAGEIFLYHSSLTKKASSNCVKKGGVVKSSTPKSVTQLKVSKNSRWPSSSIQSQGYCVKRISKLNTYKFKQAFLKKKIHVSMELPAADLEIENDIGSL